MDWKEIGAKVSLVAPSLGAALGGPAGAAVGALVAAAFGTRATPDAVSAAVSADPDAAVKLREIELRHAETLAELEFRDAAAEHGETQTTVRAGDVAEDAFVRRTRPGQSWLSLFAAIAYTFLTERPDIYILGLLLTLPWAYAGLRQIGKGVEAIADRGKR